MTKGGESTTYFVGHVPPVEKSNTLMSRDDMYKEPLYIPEDVQNRDDEYASPSNDSKRVRFLQSGENMDEDSPNGKHQKEIIPNGDVRNKSRNSQSSMKIYTPSRDSPTKSYHSPSPSKSRNNNTSPTKSVLSSVDSVKFKFHASNDVTPDLLLPEKRSDSKTNSRTISVVSNANSETFKYHASPDVKVEATSSNATSSVKNEFNNVFITSNVSDVEDEDYVNEEINTERTGSSSTSSKRYIAERIKERNKGNLLVKQIPRNVKLNHNRKNENEAERLTDEKQSSQSDNVTSLPPAKQNGTLVTGNDIYNNSDNNSNTNNNNNSNNNSKNKGDTRITHGQDGYFKNKKISSPPLKKNMKPRTGSAPSEIPKEPAEDTPRLHINNLIGFDKNDKKSQNHSRGTTMAHGGSIEEDGTANTRTSNTRDTKNFSNSYIKAKVDNPTNYATTDSKTEVLSSVEKPERVKSEPQPKTSTSSKKETQKTIVKSESVKPSDSSKDEINKVNSNSVGTNNNGKSVKNSEPESKSDFKSESVVKTSDKGTGKSNNTSNVTKRTTDQKFSDKQEKKTTNGKSDSDQDFKYHAQSPEYSIPDQSSNKENDVPPLDLSNKPKTQNGVFKFTIHKNRPYQSKSNYKRWSSKSDPTGKASPSKERPKSILANNQEASRPITKSRPRTFRMDDKEKSIYRATTFQWDADTSEAFHTPAVNRSKGITKVYTGETNIREALKSARGNKSNRPKSTKTPFVFQRRSKVPPWYEKAKVLSRQQVNIYQNIQSTYGEENIHRKRENQFLEKVEKCQIEQTRQEYEEMMERERKRKDAKRVQARQLKELRKRFEDEAWHRFQTQYVTSRILEHEKLNRYEYGLPEEPTGEPEFAAKLKRKKKVPPGEYLTADKLKKVNQKKFGNIFKMKIGPQVRPKTPLMEGIDTVVITQTDQSGDTKTITSPSDMEKETYQTNVHVGESNNKNLHIEGGKETYPTRVHVDESNNKTILPAEVRKGNTKEKKRMVKNVITEAQDQMLKVPKKGSGLTPREDSETEREVSRKTPSLNFDDDDDDDDMSDIFEHARKKYNLDIDED